MIKRNTLEDTLIDKVNSAKVSTQEKYFKQFVKTKEDKERSEIGAKMNALDSVVFDLVKEIRGSIK